VYPARAREVNAELCQVLVYLEAPNVVAKTLKLMAGAPTQEEQLEYGRALRVLKTGWTLPQRKEYFTWFRRAANFKGGASIGGFLRIMKTDSVATLTPVEKAELKPILEAKPLAPTPIVGKPRPLVKQWKLDEVAAVVEKGMKARRDFDRGRRLFGEAQCFACHRFDGEGGAMGPDLTGAAGRFSVRDLLESVVEPSKVISDQYAAVEITTTDGKVVVGRIVNLHDNNVSVNTNMLDPNALTNVNRRKIESMAPSKVSMMPTGLLDTFHEDEVADLAAYLLSRGDRNHKVYTATAGGQEKKAEPPAVAPRKGKRETIRLFNGKDLEGWEGHKKYWSVRDGVIVGKNTEPVPVSTYLLTKRKFSDFRLVFDFKLAKSEMHSGIAMWGRVAPEKGDPYTYAGHLVMFPSGYGFYDLYGRNGIHDNAAKARKVGKQHDWNHMEILAQGNRVRFVLNGVLISDWREPLPERIKEAPLGLQLHSNKEPQEVQFKGLVLETFPEDKLTTLKEAK
jgi:putative heme-binding domain-containing protein